MSLFIPEMSASPSDHNHVLRQTPLERIESMTEKASQVTALSPGLHTLVAGTKDDFLRNIDIQINLIHTRSADLEDAEITIWDKVLLALSRDGDNIDNPAVITWYARKYWGRNSDGPIARNTAPAAPVPESHTASNQAQESHALLSVASPPATSSPPKPEGSKSLFETDPIFEKQWSVYQKALDDYQNIADDQDEARLEAARFLRDTAENGVHYLSRISHSDENLTTELETTRDMANQIVETLSGGRKRKFDQTTDKGSDRRKIHHSQWEPRHRHHHHHHTSAREPPSEPRADRESRARGDPRIDNQPASYGRLNDGVHRRQHNRADHGVRQPVSGHGRGHSGVPFGYTRPVDSYVPGRRHRSSSK